MDPKFSPPEHKSRMFKKMSEIPPIKSGPLPRVMQKKALSSSGMHRQKAEKIAESQGREVIYNPKNKTYTQEKFPKK